jgi:hypothetical protein
MVRLVASKVSALSSCVAKRDQTIHHVPCSPSKIPYVGFSPIRLQTGCQWQPSPTVRQFKRKVRIHHLPVNLYATPAAISGTCGPFRHACRRPLIPALQSRGPWLAARLCCPSRSTLTTASSATLDPTTALSASSSRPYPTTWYGLVSRASPLYSVCLSLRAIFRTPAFRMAAFDCSFTTRTGLHPFCTGSAPASHAVGSRVGCVTRLQSSLHATARRVARPSPTRAFTFELSPPESPPGDVEYNYTSIQSTPVTGLLPARHTALWAANRYTQINTDFNTPRPSSLSRR